MQELLVKHADILCCPNCRGSISITGGEALACQSCKAVYPSDSGIPLLFAPHDGQGAAADVTDAVKAFYERNPFPNYDDLDSKETLAEKASRGIFARLLDEQLPGGSIVLECGCGTGQLSNFLGIRWNRAVLGSDLCLNSLRLAKGFRDRCGIRNAAFLQMNLFRPAFKPEVFDLIICNGVLHHTSDPLGGFRSISRLVKPRKFIIIGLYNAIGRLATDFRRLLFRVSGDRLRFVDGHMRNGTYNESRKLAWFMDQYKHPHESKHSYSEVLGWFESNGFDFVFSVPKIDPGPFTAEEQIFVPHDKGTKATRFLTEVGLALRRGDSGGLFMMIGRKSQGRVAEAASPMADATAAAGTCASGVGLLN